MLIGFHNKHHLIMHSKIIHERLVILKLLSISSNKFCKMKHLLLNNNEIKGIVKQSEKCNWNKQFVRLGYTEGVEGQSIAKLIVARLLRKLGNSIYRRSGDGQTVAARGQTSKGGLILHVGPKGFQFCLFSYMMMYNNWWLLFNREDISKIFYLKHGEIVFWILTLFFFLWLLFSANDDDDYWCWDLNYLNYHKLILAWSSWSWIISLFD